MPTAGGPEWRAPRGPTSGAATDATPSVMEAGASGHQPAESIHRYLQGDALEPEPKPELPVVKLTRAELERRVRRGEIQPTGRVPMVELPVAERLGGPAALARGSAAAPAPG